MTIVATIAVAGLVVALAGCLYRLVKGPSLADRAVALDTTLVLIVSAIAVGAAYTDDDTYLDVLVVVALLGFVGTAIVSRYIERRHR
jgi:multicomponent Na+:H+ antiporter subunit F